MSGIEKETFSAGREFNLYQAVIFYYPAANRERLTAKFDDVGFGIIKAFARAIFPKET